jgi:hypothetical protein
MRVMAGTIFGRLCRPSYAFLLLTVALVMPLYADDIEDARRAAVDFHKYFDSNSMYELYDSFAGETVRSMVTKDAFIAQMAVFHGTFGGAATRTTIQETKGLYTDGRAMVTIRYSAKFPSMTVYEDLSLIKDNPGGWKMFGIYFYPTSAPPPSRSPSQ